MYFLSCLSGQKTKSDQLCLLLSFGGALKEGVITVLRQEVSVLYLDLLPN